MGLRRFLRCRSILEFGELRQACFKAERDGVEWMGDKEWLKVDRKSKGTSGMGGGFKALAQRPFIDNSEVIPRCPKCRSTSITVNKKGFGVGKALVGGALTGGIGLLAGGVGANKIQCTCLACGHKFKAGQWGK